MTRTAGQRGLKAISHRPNLMLHDFRGRQSDVGRTAPESFDATQGLMDFGMLGNDKESNCGPCGIEHWRMLKALLSVISGMPTFEAGFAVPTTEHTESWYYAYGIAQGEPGPKPDQGVDNASMLEYLFEITEGKIPTPAGDDVQAWAYAELDASDINELKCGVVDFSGVLTGQCLPDNAEQDFEAEPQVPWTIDAGDPADPNEGHDTVFAKYDPTMGWTITWGGVQPFTLPTYLTGEEAAKALDAWVLVTEEDVKSGKLTADQFAALVAQCKINGRVNPDIPAPAPGGPVAADLVILGTPAPELFIPSKDGTVESTVTLHITLVIAKDGVVATNATRAQIEKALKGLGMVTASAAGSVTAVKDPSWDNPTAIQTFLTTFMAIAVTVIALVHPGFSDPSWIRKAVPTVAIVAATAIHLWINRKAILAAVERTLGQLGL